MIFHPGQQNEATKFILKHFVDGKSVEIEAIQQTRTNQQNRAVRKYFSLLAKKLNDEGYSYLSKGGKTLKFTTIKIENDFRERMQEMYGILSTKELTTQMIDDVYDCMNFDYATDYGVEQAFPCKESLLNEIDSKNI